MALPAEIIENLKPAEQKPAAAPSVGLQYLPLSLPMVAGGMFCLSALLAHIAGATWTSDLDLGCDGYLQRLVRKCCSICHAESSENCLIATLNPNGTPEIVDTSSRDRVRGSRLLRLLEPHHPK